ncbi:hypothetical protein DAPPUDRAFT_314390 [Daphnia pulex]|uniref:Uncharacterized protein n=1 Tax=Daphnia pulex TaxID=6669 RepID=E9G5Z5_DAPPU|nr:hypothetical protein DAPPUDRAFT_314390 [Daphnia pulex]|eukprot:EFX84850.1 hypothetical protein DAPPUDRAFT_314390 [Daphnia pulex]
MLFKFIQAVNSQCKTRTDLETFWAGCFSDPIVRDAVDELLLVEEKWDQFLQTVDTFMDKTLYSKNQVVGVDEIASLALVNTTDNTSSTMKQLINNQPSVVVFLRHFA